eukprot:1157446-Pelagomonas_calceolata.AAC.4
MKEGVNTESWVGAQTSAGQQSMVAISDAAPLNNTKVSIVPTWPAGQQGMVAKSDAAPLNNTKVFIVPT